jgi:serine/threonine-protein kinase
MSLTIGETVGAFRIVEQLGQGGMATVFKAYHAALDRYVAIKVLHPAFKEDTTFLARFQREARVVAKLEHPHIVPVYDFAEHNGSPYLVMKFIEGETLKARLAREPLPLSETLRVVEAVGAGLDHAHRLGILHRDIKPSNVMLARDGNIYIADFGLARIALAGESTLSTDAMLGTPHYMSPEQARGQKDLDAGTDIYSFGVVMYELVVGRVPYSADTPFAVIHDHIYTPLPPPRSVNPNVPEAIERVLLKTLSKERADRYPDVAATVDAFRKAAIPYVEQLLRGNETPRIALPRVKSIAPTDPTPAVAEPTPSERGETTASLPKPPPAVAPPPGPTVAALGTTPPSKRGETAKPAPAASRRKYVFKWWHAVAGVGLVSCCCLFALAAISNDRQTPPPDTPGGPTPAVVIPGEVNDLLIEAEDQFEAGHPDEALALLDLAVEMAPDNLSVLARAGDLALANNFPLYGLENYFAPGLPLAQNSTDPAARFFLEHAGMAFYLAAADPGAGDFMRRQVETQPGLEMAAFGLNRFRIFHDEGEAALEDLRSHLESAPNDPVALFLLGDYYLSQNRRLEAARNYEQSLTARPGDRGVPAWLRTETVCNLERLKPGGEPAGLEPTCADLSSLLTGK